MNLEKEVSRQERDKIRVRGVAGIVLAAGEGSRMGRTKQLLPFRDRTMLECVVDSALASSLQRVIVVLGHQADAIEPLLKDREVTIALNPIYGKGQSTSLKAGLRALTEETEAALFLLGDQPLISTATINLILAAYEACPSPIVQPVFAGKRGNPVLFSRETFSRIEALNEDRGARSLFDEYAGRILTVPVSDPSIHLDVDTEEDYRRLLCDQNDRRGDI
ncbi:MAG: molybdenum cofactor cytidylyltransferase [Deltaproteobacteria bacterium]|nr:molybdenum cofactor cytidylyltransferase [Deltaproteobacteria bacterium]